MKKWITSIGCLMAMLTVGCMEQTTLITLDRDGSGHIVQNVYISPMLTQMMDGMGGETDGIILNEEDAQKAASQFGQGIRVVSVTPLTRPDGSKGARALFAFDDINKVVLDMDMGGEASMDMGDDAFGDAAPAEDAESTPVRFEYTEGKLIIHMPHDDADDVEGEGDVDMDMGGMEGMDEMGQQMMQGMLPMMRGMRVRFVVQVPSEIKETNASHVVEHNQTGVRQYVNLLDFHIDKLLDDPDGINKLMKLDGMNEKAAMKMLSEAGLQVETEKTITIEF